MVKWILMIFKDFLNIYSQIRPKLIKLSYIDLVGAMDMELLLSNHYGLH